LINEDPQSDQSGDCMNIHIEIILKMLEKNCNGDRAMYRFLHNLFDLEYIEKPGWYTDDYKKLAEEYMQIQGDDDEN